MFRFGGYISGGMCLYLFRHLSIYLWWKIAYIIHLEHIFNDSPKKKKKTNLNTLALKSPKNVVVIAWMFDKSRCYHLSHFSFYRKRFRPRDAVRSNSAALINYTSTWRSERPFTFPMPNNRFLCSMTHDNFFGCVWMLFFFFFHLSFVCNPFSVRYSLILSM